MISFVYFDVGGVITDEVVSRPAKWIKMKCDIGIPKEKDEEFNLFFKEQDKWGCGGREIDEIVPLIRERFNTGLPLEYSFFTDCINRFDKNEHILPIIKESKKRYRVGLLTNMYPRMLSAFMKKGIVPKEGWDVIIDSSVEKCQKPEEKIFQLAEERAEAKKDEILFIDNNAENIKAAQDFGWQTFYYDASDHQKTCADLMAYYKKVISD